MISGRRVTALIPARGGSKTVKNKNIRLLYGKPLIAWTIELALSVNEIDSVIVSTDESTIASISEKYGAEVLPRPAEFAQDHSMAIDVIRHGVSGLSLGNRPDDVMLYLEPTCPLRSQDDIQKGLEILASDEGYDSVASFHQADLHPHRAWKMANGQPVPFIDGAIPWIPRQKLSEAYQLNGVFYGFRIDSISAQSVSLINGKIGFFITPKERAIDIDDETDFALAELLLQRKCIHEKNS